MEFEYSFTSVATQTLDIEDIGQCAIEVVSEDDLYKILVIKTVAGVSYIFQYGPYVPDLNKPQPAMLCTLNQTAFNNVKIKKIIDRFLNTSSTKEAHVIDIDTALNECKNLADYIRELK